MPSRSVRKTDDVGIPALTFAVCGRLATARREIEIATTAAPLLARLGADFIAGIEVPASSAERPQVWFGRDEPGFGPLLREGLQNDPIYRAVRRAPRSGSWTEVLGRRRLGVHARELLSSAKACGLHEGYAVPVFGVGGLAGVVEIAGSALKLDPAARIALEATATRMFRRIEALRSRRRRGALLLTRREIEILRWILDGKSDWQIGQILRISSKTVNFHVENVKRKFGVATRIQAVIAAVRRGHIHP